MGDGATGSGVVHPLYVRITHWINALAVLVMIGSGWQIYNAAPLFAFTFPAGMTLGGWLAGGLLWHFAAMWLLVANGLVYLVTGAITGRLRQKLLPVRPGDVLADTRRALAGTLSYEDPRVYNAVQKLLYVGAIIAGLVIAASGLAMWKPVQLQELAALFGGYEGARLVHFFAMLAIVAFVVLHVVMALLYPRRLRSMLRGR
jgi:thiosulfate reductase cytochrome b subunit